jgi:hypothetical protein
MVVGCASLLVPLALLAAPDAASAQSGLTREQAQQIHRDCSTIEACIAAMRTETAINGSGILEQKFAAFGEDAVEPLIEVLTGDPDPRMRSYAGRTLWRMPRIDARHLPVLIAASRQGDPMPFLDDGPGWIAIPIGLVRDNPEALAYLFDLVEIYGARSSSNAVQPAIERSSQAAWLAEAQRRLEGFRPEQGAEYLGVVSELVIYGGHGRSDDYTTPAWLEPALVRIATDPAVNADARDTAAALLGHFRHPIALAALLRDARVRFAALPAWDGRSRFVRMKDAEGRDQWERLSDGAYESVISEIGRFGPAGLEAAPLLRPFLTRPDLPGSRAEAALALGQIGDRSAIPLLISAAGDRDDWLLAYNAVESLGRLRAVESRELLREIAANHWSQAVRNNAGRAINMIDGGDFARPGIAGDGRHINDDLGDDDALYMGQARYKNDDQGGGPGCSLSSETRLRLAQSPVGRLRFPREGDQRIEARAVPRRDVPRFPESLREQLPRGQVTAIETLRHGVLIGAGAGEFIGGLAYVDDRQREATVVVDDNISMVFRHGGRLYALTGLSHMGLSSGEIWQIDEESRPPRATRRIPLPAEANRVLATARRDIAFVTDGGTFLLAEDGTLRSGGDEATCHRPLSPRAAYGAGVGLP